MSRARHEEHKKHHKSGGGRIGMVAAGNPDVITEAHSKEPYDEGDERKRGGKVKKKKHGMMPEGKMAKHRMDRPGRKMGGRVGSDKAPMSSAHHSSKTGEKAGGEPD